MQFEVSDNAIKRIKFLAKDKEDGGVFFRIAVDGGGCNGFKYNYELTNKLHEEDLIVEREGVKILIDPISSDFLKNCTLNYVEEMVGQYFEVKNPNSVSKCGCGNSFAL